jgi:predicted amidohydrolase YtcJ
MRPARRLLPLCLSLLAAGCATTGPGGDAAPADAAAAANAAVVYRGGPIITMDDARPAAAAVAVRDGRIIAVGTESEATTAAGPDARVVDLAGRTMLPGFVDSHGHAYMIGLQATTANLLPPPDGLGADIPSLQRLLTDWAGRNRTVIERVGWIVGFGYDDSQLAEGRHPTRDELDAVSSELPVIIIHQSGHLGVANGTALAMAGVDADTDDPPGGVFRRRPGSRELNGVLEEQAFFRVMGALAARFDDRVNEVLVVEGTRLAASFGYTTVQEGRAMQPSIDAMRRVAGRGELDVDLVVYPDIIAVPDIRPSRAYTDRLRIGGAKLTIDGSPQGRTAWLAEPYHVVPEGLPADYRGYPSVDEDEALAAIERAFANRWQLLCHANGDAAIDLFLEGVRRARDRHGDIDVRPVLIHGQVTRRDQVATMDELGVFPSLFPMHTYYWGDWHRETVLGPDRAEDISPTGWVRERGMWFGSHHDAPVALPDSMRVLSATVTRRTRTGDILGPHHRVSVMDGLRALTIWPAWQHFEEADKGSIEVGKLADFVILSDNPLEVPEDQLAGLLVLETIKEGRTIHRRPEGQASIAGPAMFGVTLDRHHAAHAHAHGHVPGLDGMTLVCGDGCFNHALSVLHHVLTGGGTAAP